MRIGATVVYADQGAPSGFQHFLNFADCILKLLIKVQYCVRDLPMNTMARAACTKKYVDTKS